MFLKRTKSQSPATWSPELWSDVAGAGSNFQTLLLVERFKQKTDLNFGERSPDIERTFFGKVADSNSSDKSFAVSASLNFQTAGHDQAQSRIPFDAVGWVHTINWGKGENAYPTLAVNLRCDKNIVQTFEDMFTRAKLVGSPYLPVWLWGEPRSEPTTDASGAFAIVQPLTRCIFEQDMKLGN